MVKAARREVRGLFLLEIINRLDILDYEKGIEKECREHRVVSLLLG